MKIDYLNSELHDTLHYFDYMDRRRLIFEFFEEQLSQITLLSESETDIEKITANAFEKCYVLANTFLFFCGNLMLEISISSGGNKGEGENHPDDRYHVNPEILNKAKKDTVISFKKFASFESPNPIDGDSFILDDFAYQVLNAVELVSKTINNLTMQKDLSVVTYPLNHVEAHVHGFPEESERKKPINMRFPHKDPRMEAHAEKQMGKNREQFKKRQNEQRELSLFVKKYMEEFYSAFVGGTLKFRTNVLDIITHFDEVCHSYGVESKKSSRRIGWDRVFKKRIPIDFTNYGG